MSRRPLVLLAGLAILLSSCATNPGSTPASLIEIHESDVTSVRLEKVQPVAGGNATNRAGDSVTVSDPSRVVSVATGVAEIIQALGAADALVGRDLKTEISSLATVPVVTDVHALNAEKVLAQHPTLVIADAQTTPGSALDQVEAAGVQVIVMPEVWRLDQVADRITQVGAALGVPDQVTALLDNMAPDYEKATLKYSKVAFLYLRGTASIYLIGGKESGADSLLTAAGATDLGAKAGLAPFAPLTPETLAQMQPEVLLVMTKGLDSVSGVKGLVELPGVKQTPAAKAKRVIAVDDGLLLAFDTRCLKLVQMLNEALASYE